MPHTDPELVKHYMGRPCGARIGRLTTAWEDVDCSGCSDHKPLTAADVDLDGPAAAYLAWLRHRWQPISADTAAAFNAVFRGHWTSQDEYARHYARIVGAYDPDGWPSKHIDWEAATAELFGGGNGAADHFTLPAEPEGIYVFGSTD